MRATLQRHLDSPRSAATQIEVDVAHPRPGSLALVYVVTGKIDDLAIPPRAAAERTDALWQHTCFEAFVRISPDAAYYEFNFAPSTQWAAYRFSGYRSGMQVATEIDAPRIAVEANSNRFVLRAHLELDRMPNSTASGDRDHTMWRLGLAAVIEEASGTRSYWALAHPPGKPDFHHSDCFALKVA